MILHPVVSSNIQAIGHDPRTNELVIQFKNGSKYRYPGVTTAQYEAFRAAESAGKHFAAHVKGLPFTKEA